MSEPRTEARSSRGDHASAPSGEPGEFVARGREVLALEGEAVSGMASQLGEAFAAAVELVLGVSGRVVATGVGKSGIVARKLAATLTSTGTPAVFLHPVDAMHGDLGIVGKEDAVVLVSKSAATDELVRMLPVFRRYEVPVLLVTSDASGPLADAADVVLSTGPVTESSSIPLVPTTSTLAQLALGDALAVVVMEARGFRERDFAYLHPGGVIGRTVGKSVRDVMHEGTALPVVGPEATMREALEEISDKRLGVTLVVSPNGQLAGILTDGDLKRILLTEHDVLSLRVSDVMTRTPRTIDRDASTVAAVARMENNPGGRITSLVVVDGDVPIGVIHLHDCLRP